MWRQKRKGGRREEGNGEVEYEPAFFSGLKQIHKIREDSQQESKTTLHIVKKNCFSKKNIITDGKLCVL